MLDKLLKDLEKLKNPKKAKDLQRFFKTGRGEYGEGDIFLGIVVPIQRQLVKKYKNLSFKEIQTLLNSKIHEQRLIALLILVERYRKAETKTRKIICDFYLKNIKNINNWDLVDLSAPHITGAYFFKKSKATLYQLASSKDLWKRRIAVLSTFYFIRENQLNDSLKTAEILLKDKHDLIHKAVGWMLREVGKRDKGALEEFLDRHSKSMPRTMLRYAIEKFEEKKRRYYLKQKS